MVQVVEVEEAVAEDSEVAEVEEAPSEEEVSSLVK
jgi:hypothetical protein